MSFASPASHPYSPAVATGNLAFVSGALSVDPEGNAVEGRTEALDAAIDRMTERLATVGGQLSDVVKLTYYVTDLTLRDDANAQFERIFAEPRPARTFLAVAGLPYGASVEIDAIAALPQRP
ncbi:RidA family protein [Tsukamurella pseudospumae]|uniref:Enamine deaminase RidA n=1 Tax=Tsukamurella pseudospumae TaxID=239498 RepID=A0A138AUG0_9ACTN|nr:RidA family protein [Tsukamurella pseudospumae]KXO98964.1 enamine deaminase RidA [Tsukamurella pseudospumae]KXP14016.1 enamine deaminase RidA [Tsukamurella pseudospumae]